MRYWDNAYVGGSRRLTSTLVDWIAIRHPAKATMLIQDQTLELQQVLQQSDAETVLLLSSTDLRRDQ